MALDEPYRSRAAQVGTGVQRFNQVRLDHQDLGIGEFGRRNPDDFNRPCLQQRSLPGVSAIVKSVWMRQVWSRSLASHPNRFLIIWRWWEMRQTAILGLAGWGAKSSAAVLAKLVHLESIPKDCREWRVNAANASALAD